MLSHKSLRNSLFSPSAKHVDEEDDEPRHAYPPNQQAFERSRKQVAQATPKFANPAKHTTSDKESLEAADATLAAYVRDLEEAAVAIENALPNGSATSQPSEGATRSQLQRNVITSHGRAIRITGKHVADYCAGLGFTLDQWKRLPGTFVALEAALDRCDRALRSVVERTDIKEVDFSLDPAKQPSSPSPNFSVEAGRLRSTTGSETIAISHASSAPRVPSKDRRAHAELSVTDNTQAAIAALESIEAGNLADLGRLVQHLREILQHEAYLESVDETFHATMQRQLAAVIDRANKLEAAPAVKSHPAYAELGRQRAALDFAIKNPRWVKPK